MPRKKTKDEKAGPGKGRRRRRSQPPSDDLYSMLMDLIAGRLPISTDLLVEFRRAELQVLKVLRMLLDRHIQQLESRSAPPQPTRVEKVDLS